MAELKHLIGLPRGSDAIYIAKDADAKTIKAIDDLISKNHVSLPEELREHALNVVTAKGAGAKRKAILVANAATGGGFLDWVKNAASKAYNVVKDVVVDKGIDFAKDHALPLIEKAAKTLADKGLKMVLTKMG